MIFRKLSFFIIFIGLMAVFFNYAFIAHAETSPPKPEPRLIYIENISLALAEKAKTMSPEKCQKFPLPDSVCNPKDWETALVPYMIYGEMLSGSPDNQPFTIDLNERPNWLSDYQSDPEFRGHINSALEDAFKKASEAQSKIIKKTVLEYAQTYGYISRPIIKLEELPLYEDKGHKGDLNAIFELRRYYANPEIKNYNPEQTETRYWLFQAIKAGSQEAMLEAGYDRPYAVRTELSHEGTQITLDANCEKIDTSGGEARPACFIYNLIISETPQQTGHVVLDADHLTGQSMSPKELALKKFNGQVVVELVSYADKTPALIRKDYFDLEGRYLGVNAPKFRPNYFWNYKETPLSAPPLIFKETGKTQTLAKEEVRALPYVEAFMFWEEEYPKEERLKAGDDLDWAAPPCELKISTSYEGCLKTKHCSFEQKKDIYTKYSRMTKFFKMDMYDENQRINSTNKIRNELESAINSHYLDQLNYLGPEADTACSGMMIWRQLSSKNTISELLLKEYNAKTSRMPYVFFRPVELPNATVLLVCHLNGCFAVQAKYNLNGVVKYHYWVSVKPIVIEPAGTDSENRAAPVGIAAPVLFTANAPDDNQVYIVMDDSYGYNRLHKTSIFDKDFNYLGSTDTFAVADMIYGFKPLPFDLRSRLTLKNLSKDSSGLALHFPVLPESEDMLIELRRKNIEKEILR